MSSKKVTKHSWLEMKEPYIEVIQPEIDKYPIQKEDVMKVKSCPLDDKKRSSSSSSKYQLRSGSSDSRDEDIVNQNARMRSDKDDSNSSPIKRHRSGIEQSSSEEERHPTSTSSSDKLLTDGALKAQPTYRRLKASDLQLNVIKLGNEKCDRKRKKVPQWHSKRLDKSAEVSDACQKETKLIDLRMRVALLSDDISSNESAEEQLKTAKKRNKTDCISSLSRSRRMKKSWTEKSSEPDVLQDSNQADTSVSEEIFTVESKTLTTSLSTQGSSRRLQPSKGEGKGPPTVATPDEHPKVAGLTLENEVNNAEKTENLVIENSEETEKNLLVCEKLMSWLSVSPEVFAQSVLMNCGNVDDAVHWLLFSKTASGNAVWDAKDDKDLLNGDEEIYKLLEEKYGEALTLKRQQFLAMNSSLCV